MVQYLIPTGFQTSESAGLRGLSQDTGEVLVPFVMSQRAAFMKCCHLV